MNSEVRRSTENAIHSCHAARLLPHIRRARWLRQVHAVAQAARMARPARRGRRRHAPARWHATGRPHPQPGAGLAPHLARSARRAGPHVLRSRTGHRGGDPPRAGPWRHRAVRSLHRFDRGLSGRRTSGLAPRVCSHCIASSAASIPTSRCFCFRTSMPRSPERDSAIETAAAVTGKDENRFESLDRHSSAASTISTASSRSASLCVSSPSKATTAWKRCIAASYP